jgi:TRAP-type transport system periplasmic protein
MGIYKARTSIAFIGMLLISLGQHCLAQTILNIATEYPETAMPGEGLNTFANSVKQLSNGRLIFIPSFDAKAGFKSADIVNAVAEKKVAAGDAYMPALSAINPLFSLSALPFVATSIEDAKSLMLRSRSEYQDALSKAGVRWLYATPWPASGIWSKDKLQTSADIKALKIRTYDAVSQEVMLSLTTASMNISFADVMPMLSDGRATAVLSSGDGGAGRKLWDFLPHFTEINYAIPISVTVINTAIYESLSPELKQSIDQAATQTEAEQWQRIQGRLEENYARMRANGVIINTIPDSQLKSTLIKAAKPVIEAWKQKVGAKQASLVTTP